MRKRERERRARWRSEGQSVHDGCRGDTERERGRERKSERRESVNETDKTEKVRVTERNGWKHGVACGMEGDRVCIVRCEGVCVCVCVCVCVLWEERKYNVGRAASR